MLGGWQEWTNICYSWIFTSLTLLKILIFTFSCDFVCWKKKRWFNWEKAGFVGFDLWLSGRNRRGGHKRAQKGKLERDSKKNEGWSQNKPGNSANLPIGRSCSLKVPGSFLERSGSQLVWVLNVVSFWNLSNRRPIFIHPLSKEGSREKHREGRKIGLCLNLLTSSFLESVTLNFLLFPY